MTRLPSVSSGSSSDSLKVYRHRSPLSIRAITAGSAADGAPALDGPVEARQLKREGLMPVLIAPVPAAPFLLVITATLAGGFTDLPKVRPFGKLKLHID